MTRTLLLAIAASALAACASNNPPMPTNAAVEDFISAGELESVEKIRRRDSDSWKAINERYILYKARRDNYLIAFRRDCPTIVDGLACRQIPGTIRNPADVQGCMDVRIDTRNLRARVDTIRSCIISDIYPVTPGQVIELKNLGYAEIPGPPS